MSPKEREQLRRQTFLNRVDDAGVSDDTLLAQIDADIQRLEDAEGEAEYQKLLRELVANQPIGYATLQTDGKLSLWAPGTPPFRHVEGPVVRWWRFDPSTPQEGRPAPARCLYNEVFWKRRSEEWDDLLRQLTEPGHTLARKVQATPTGDFLDFQSTAEPPAPAEDEHLPYANPALYHAVRYLISNRVKEGTECRWLTRRANGEIRVWRNCDRKPTLADAMTDQGLGSVVMREPDQKVWNEIMHELPKGEFICLP